MSKYDGGLILTICRDCYDESESTITVRPDKCGISDRALADRFVEIVTVHPDKYGIQNLLTVNLTMTFGGTFL